VNKNGLALFALILAALSFFNLMGLEKALLAVVAGLFCLPRPGESKALAWVAIALGLSYLAIVAVITLLHLPQLTALLGGI
jgi:hypothetical protein